MRALFNLLAAHRNAAVPIARFLQLTEFLRAVGVAALADGEIGVFLTQRHRRIKRGDRGHPFGLPLNRHRTAQGIAGLRIEPPQHLIERANMVRARAAAAADHIDAVFADEAFEPGRQFLRAQRVMGFTVHQFRQARIRLHRNKPRPAFAQPFHMLGHFLRTRSAVEPHNVHIERMDHRRRRRNIGPHQQRAGGFDRYLNHQTDGFSGLFAGALGAIDGGFDLKRVLASFDKDGIHTARNQARRLNVERILKALIIDMAEAGQARARPDGAKDKTLPPIGLELLARLIRVLAREPV